MKKHLLIIIIIGLVSCQKKDPWKKSTVDVDEVDSITMVADPYQEIRSSFKLTDLQTKNIIEKWNNAPQVGLVKYAPKFEMTMYFNDGSTRNFRVNEGFIKEDNDVCYDLGDKRFINNLMEK